MNKKIVMGSIGAAIILILVSFTTVIGFQSTDSSKVKLSPLFQIRTKQIIDDEKLEKMESNYLGKNSNNIIPFSIDTSKNRMIQTMITRIQRMDTTEFSALKQLLLQKCREDSKLNHQLELIENELEKIRENLELLKNFIVSRVEKNPRLITVDGFWLPGCLLVSIFEIFIILFINIACSLCNPPTLLVP